MVCCVVRSGRVEDEGCRLCGGVFLLGGSEEMSIDLTCHLYR